MKFPFFASFIVFIILLTLRLRHSGRKDAKAADEYWKKELQANATRRKSLDQLPYITIPFDRLPMDVLATDDSIQEIQKTLKALSETKMVNFNGKSNTDLKLEYGAPNINLLAEYDQNYTDLIICLNKWGALLLEKGESPAAQTVLEYAVEIGSDISATHKMLADLYINPSFS